MKTVLVCSPMPSTRERLTEGLSRNGFAVEAVDGHADVLAFLKEERRDVVVAEARRDRFADFLRVLLTLRPGTHVHLFEADVVFCHYPLNRQPVPLLFALDSAGLTLPGRRREPLRAGNEIMVDA